jgi:hypothetical protein
MKNAKNNIERKNRLIGEAQLKKNLRTPSYFFEKITKNSQKSKKFKKIQKNPQNAK